ncbi:MAG: phosphatase [Ruminiclostridium sp.]|nr:phosphatase [Ruminiclostridium sp.]
MRLFVDSHTHTLASGHSYSTVQELAQAARDNGIEMIAITDHGPALKGAPTVIHFWNLKVIPAIMYGVRVIKGAEVNITDYSGKYDIPDWALKQLDFAIASFHDIVIKPSTVEDHTSAMEAVLANPYIDAVAHPGNPIFQVDIDRVVKAAAKYGKLIEINNHSFTARRGSDENCLEFARKCRQYGVRTVCGSDAHISFDVGNLGKVEAILKEADLPDELVLCSSAARFEEYLEERKARIVGKLAL